MTSDKKKASQKAWYEANKERIQEKARQYRMKAYYENIEYERTKSLERYYQKKVSEQSPDQK